MLKAELEDAIETEIKAIAEYMRKNCSKMIWGRWMPTKQYYYLLV